MLFASLQRTWLLVAGPMLLGTHIFRGVWTSHICFSTLRILHDSLLHSIWRNIFCTLRVHFGPNFMYSFWLVTKLLSGTTYPIYRSSLITLLFAYRVHISMIYWSLRVQDVNSSIEIFLQDIFLVSWTVVKIFLNTTANLWNYNVLDIFYIFIFFVCSSYLIFRYVEHENMILCKILFSPFPVLIQNILRENLYHLPAFAFTKSNTVKKPLRYPNNGGQTFSREITTKSLFTFIWVP